ncbi:MAG: hypothetical protein IJ088_11130 [Clostridia bacterium]|nr:hypothetical protein [Clostridia bacterium]
MRKNPESSFLPDGVKWLAVAVLLVLLAFLVPSPAMMEPEHFEPHTGRVSGFEKAVRSCDPCAVWEARMG